MDFDTCVTKIWGVSASILLNKFLAKIFRWGISREIAVLHQIRAWSRGCHIWFIGDFGTHHHVVDPRIWPKCATFNDLFMTQVLNPPLGGGGRMAWVAILYPLPPHQGILLFVSFFLITWHLGFFLEVSCPSCSSTSFWSLRSHPGMATCCCTALKAASSAQ